MSSLMKVETMADADTEGMAVKDHQKGPGPTVREGYDRGDSWIPADGSPHSKCKGGRTYVVGHGITPEEDESWVEGVMLRCSCCLGSWVIT